MKTLVVVSDIHHAGQAERERRGFESSSIPNPVLRTLARIHRYTIWMRDPFSHLGHLDKFLVAAGEPDIVVANGDYSLDSAFVGLADDAVFESVRECLERLRSRFGQRLHLVFGDHELGKMNLFGGAGGLRLASYRRATRDLGLKPFWTLEVGNYVLMAFCSTLAALPIYLPEMIEAERAPWQEIRLAHLDEIRRAFSSLRPNQRVLLFTHDPTSLPFLSELDEVRTRMHQIERTVIGHLHSEFILHVAQTLAGMPSISFLGNTVRRYSSALRRARRWAPFKLLLCPSVAGIQLRKDGGFLRLQFDPDGLQPLQISRQPLAWG